MAEKINKVAKRLFSELEARLEKGEYPVFPPQKIEVHGRGKIKFDAVNAGANLRECLRLFGATLYHLLNNESEFTHESYRFDPASAYKNFPDSNMGEFVRYLLSGNAFDLDSAERRLNATDKLINTKSLFRALWSASAWLISKAGTAFRWFWLKVVLALRAICRFILRCLRVLFSWLIPFLIVVNIFLWIVFNIPFSSTGGIVGLSVLFVISLGLSSIIGIIIEEEGGFRERGRNIFIGITFSIFFGLFGLMAFSYSSDIDHMRESALIERDSGAFVARLPVSKDDVWLSYRDDWINHFQYEVIPGIPAAAKVSANVPLDSWPLANAGRLGAVKVVVEAKINNENVYLAQWRRWKNDAAFYDGLQEALNKLAPKIESRLLDAAENDPDLIQRYLLFRTVEEISELEMDGKALNQGAYLYYQMPSIFRAVMKIAAIRREIEILKEVGGFIAEEMKNEFHGVRFTVTIERNRTKVEVKH